MDMSSRPKLGVSACLLGHEVRYDGGHKRSRYVEGSLGAHVDWVIVCPERESGLGVPREPISIIRETKDGASRLIGQRSGRDYTPLLEGWARRRLELLDEERLDGFVFRRKSPSCGLRKVAAYRDPSRRDPIHDGSGIFASMLEKRFGSLPLTEDGWLCDSGLRESFLDRVFTHWRFGSEVLHEPSVKALRAFHKRHKLLYMAHSPLAYRKLGRLVAGARESTLEALLPVYLHEAMVALDVRTSTGKHANVLQHIMGYFKRVIDAREKKELLAAIDDYRAGLHDIAVPLALLSHHLMKHPESRWLVDQVYFCPHPRQLSGR